MIRKATLADLDAIMGIISETVSIMAAENNPQWDDTYPNKMVFEQDIQAETLYLFADDEGIKGLVCINEEEAMEYQGLAWSSDGKAMVIHRLAVAPGGRRQGIGTALILLAEELARQKGLGVLKTDTYCTNDKMHGIFLKKGFRKVGEVYFVEGLDHFNCYEKLLID